ncbi:MAG: beta-galactosidase, partial [Oscillospiraceae bacterium]|nr:beta-galactosidase [Oscillospiraceae bacterium]
MKKIIFGAAYYEEYLPYDRLEEDMRMMTEAGVNTIRIAESTWSVEEPRPGEYDFSHVDRVIDAAERHGLEVIVGTPTYAVPHWLVQLDPEVLAVTKDGPGRYGPRQIMDITNETYLKYAEGVIRALAEHTAPRKNVIGFQLDNETKHYGTSGPKVLARFRRWMAERYGTVERMNAELGFNYWSNSVTSFDDLPDPAGTINGSYACEFSRFQRDLAAEFLQWQSDIVKEYARPDQFITHNFDYEWRVPPRAGVVEGYSAGIQPDIDHYDAAKALTLVGTDIYFPTQDRLTGLEIAFGGDLMRPLRRDNYLLLESSAQGFKPWLPYPGQLRQMAYSHIASGACGVMYWNWYSLHNAIESYWKGLLSHDFAPNPTYEEAAALGAEWKALAPKLAGLKKQNRIAIVVDTGSLHALRWFPTDPELAYNDVVRWLYRALYELNFECDLIFSQETDWSGYDLLLFPALYCASEDLIARVRAFVERGGTVFATLRSFFA